MGHWARRAAIVLLATTLAAWVAAPARAALDMGDSDGDGIPNAFDEYSLGGDGNGSLPDYSGKSFELVSATGNSGIVQDLLGSGTAGILNQNVQLKEFKWGNVTLFKFWLGPVTFGFTGVFNGYLYGFQSIWITSGRASSINGDMRIPCDFLCLNGGDDEYHASPYITGIAICTAKPPSGQLRFSICNFQATGDRDEFNDDGPGLGLGYDDVTVNASGGGIAFQFDGDSIGGSCLNATTKSDTTTYGSPC